MRWWFYSIRPETPFFTRQPGLLFSPISHDIYDPIHLPANLVLLLAIGGLAEPRIGGWRVFAIVVIGGWVGTILANLTLVFHLTWTTAGASVGIFALGAYTGLRLHALAMRYGSRGLTDIEAFGTLILLIMIPIVLAFELLYNWNMGHLFGLIVGMVLYPIDRKIWL